MNAFIESPVTFLNRPAKCFRSDFARRNLRRTAPLFLVLFAVSFGATAVSGGPLTEAQVTKIINEVKIVSPAAGDRSARVNDIIRDDLALTTGIKSRSELLFQDKTLSRLGPESYFSFKTGTRD